MPAIRVTFDGKAFIPDHPISLPPQSEALVFLDAPDTNEQLQLDQAIRAYYQTGSDADDDAWAGATTPESHRAWDED